MDVNDYICRIVYNGVGAVSYSIKKTAPSWVQKIYDDLIKPYDRVDNDIHNQILEIMWHTADGFDKDLFDIDDVGSLENHLTALVNRFNETKFEKLCFDFAVKIEKITCRKSKCDNINDIIILYRKRVILHIASIFLEHYIMEE